VTPRRKDYLGLLVLLGVMSVVPLITDQPYQLNLFVMAGIYTIICVGLNLLIGYAGQMSLGQAAFYGIGAYTTAILTTKFGAPAWLGLSLAPIITGALAYLIGTPILRLRGLSLAMASFAFGEIMLILFAEQTQWTGGVMGTRSIPKIALGTFELDTPGRFYYLVWILAVFVLWIALNLVRTRVGRVLRAVRDNEDAASSLGVDTASFKVAIFALSAAFAGLGGALYAHYLSFVSPDSFNFFVNIMVIVIVIVGGMRQVWGVVLGALLMVWLGEFLRQYKELNMVIYGLALILMVAFMPGGLFGVVEQLVGRVSRIVLPPSPNAEPPNESEAT